jgi:hypothetical protein
MSSLRFRLVAVLVALSAAVTPSALLAQRVAGTVKLAGDAPGGGGILVVAKDSTGAEVVRVVTSDEGRYALPLPRSATWRIELQRVGFNPTVVVERVISGGEALTIDPVASTSVVALPLRGSVPPSSCGGSPDAQRYVSALMGEMYKALSAAQLAAARQGVSARWAVTDHRLGPNGRDTSRYTIVRRAGNPMAAFGTPVQADLQRSGYVVKAGQDRLFRGLDVAALLSPWFAESYCFTAREGNSQTFVLAFAPKDRRRDFIDVAGEINIDRATLELRSINYLYLGLSADEDQRLGGGRMTFARATGGTWLAADWYIRFPSVGYQELETFRSQDRARVLTPEVLGHEFLAWRTTALLEGTRRIYVNDAVDGPPAEGPIRTVCTERVLRTTVGAARGRLTLDGRPVSGARVRAAWRLAVDVGGEIPLWRDESREVATNNRGEWVLCDLPPGQTVELTWEVMGRKSSSMIRVERDQLATIGDDGKIVTTP